MLIFFIFESKLQQVKSSSFQAFLLLWEKSLHQVIISPKIFQHVFKWTKNLFLSGLNRTHTLYTTFASFCLLLKGGANSRPRMPSSTGVLCDYFMLIKLASQIFTKFDPVL